MSYGRGAIASAIVNDNIYVSNGYTTNGDSNIIEKYNITNNTWNILNTTLTAKRFASSEMYNNKIYVFNGWGNNGLEIVDLTTNTVTNGAVNPFYTGNAGSAIYSGKIYTFGGSGLNGSSTYSYSSKFQYYDIASNTWNSLPDMPVAKETKGKIVNNKLYVIGGFNGTNSNLINVYDFTLNAWTDQYAMPVGVSGHSIAVSNNKIFIVGDYDNQTFLAYFDTTTNQLHQLSSNMIGRRHSAAQVYNNKLYIMGGNTTAFINSSIASAQVADISEGILSANENASNVFQIKAYPNPFRDHLVISNKKDDAFDYIIFSTEGRQISKGSSNFNKNIDLSNLKKGVYIFSFKNDKGILQQIKIIKN
ncbi:T9SS type A sorting domain-containing protein [Chryseobacterium sp. PS-8]|uniref:T9SS type A sorting domain-containing protein n=1 Tax=Chryseobacterium indicum TaxID=2766954 RepID=A0ABS9C864_9FLAO|nr:T9SS type A sorting domain-containing protein [Chryseobacterium sp. PS-8]MCF2220470.1 T9SS type A sorting domain-containing protein [Chryseobacterium sp. PS-8]